MNKRNLARLLRAAERQAAAEAARRGHAVHTWEFDPEAYDFEDEDSPRPSSLARCPGNARPVLDRTLIGKKVAPSLRGWALSFFASAFFGAFFFVLPYRITLSWNASTGLEEKRPS